MELFGKVVHQPAKERKLSLAPTANLLINHKSGRLSLSGTLLTDLNCADGAIGFGYDPEKQAGTHEAYIYLQEDGCKIGNGAVSSKFHADKLRKAFEANLTEDVNRFRLEVDTKNPIDHNGLLLYPITFGTVLPDLTRSKEAAAAETLQQD